MLTSYTMSLTWRRDGFLIPAILVCLLGGTAITREQANPTLFSSTRELVYTYVHNICTYVSESKFLALQTQKPVLPARCVCQCR